MKKPIIPCLVIDYRLMTEYDFAVVQMTKINAIFAIYSPEQCTNPKDESIVM